MIVTIDGPVGTGKSTIAKLLAEKLGFVHFDTGAMYRCLTFGLIKHGIALENHELLHSLLEDFDVIVKVKEGIKHYFFEEEDITNQIRSEEVTSHVSEVSAIPEVRDKLVELQRRLGEGIDAVFEGRDMGTVVFPNAEIKFFLTASPEVRTARRFDELKKEFPDETKNLDLEKLLANINKRDAYDSTRKVSPLRPAEDAHIIDTSKLSIDQVLDELLSIKEKFTSL
jgi:CMP/dCMP kinase